MRGSQEEQMKQLRRHRAGVLLGALALVATACNPGAPATPSPVVQPTPTASPTRGAAAIKVGLMTDIGGLGDRGFNDQGKAGLDRAIAELGVEGRLLEARAETDYVPNLRQLAQDGYNPIFAMGFLPSDAVAEVAPQFPNTNFVIVGGGIDPPQPNVQAVEHREQEGAFLAGYVAGLATTSGLEGTNPEAVISWVGLVKIPPVDRYMAGWASGAKHANPDVTILSAYSQSFVDAAKCKEIALDQIANGSDVIFSGTQCGFGAFDAAAEQGVRAMSADNDYLELGDHMLGSALKRVDSVVFLMIMDATEGTFHGGGSSVFGLADEGMVLGPLASDVPADWQAQVDEIAAKILSGEIVPATDPADID
jgi:basic membrane protein A